MGPTKPTPILLALAALALAACASGAPAVPGDASAEQLMAAGIAAEEAGELRRAAAFYERVLSEHGYRPEAEEARWRSAEIAFAREHWKAARTGYDEYHETHPLDRLGEIENRMYRIGLGLYEDGQAGLLGLGIFRSDTEAMTTMQWLTDRIPGGFRADDAIFFMAEKAIDGGRWQDAVFHLDRLLTEYPESEWARESRFRKAWCHRQLNRGPAYDRSALVTAREQAGIYIREIERDEARRAEYADRLAEAKALVREVDDTLAESAWRIARFYLAQEREEAAAVYLDQLLREYPESPGAERARELGDRTRGAE